MSKHSDNVRDEINKYTPKQLLDLCKSINQELQSVNHISSNSQHIDVILSKANHIHNLIIQYYNKSGILSVLDIKRGLNHLVSNSYENLYNEVFEYLDKITTVDKSSNLEQHYFSLTKSRPLNINYDHLLLAQASIILQYNKQQLLKLSDVPQLLINKSLDATSKHTPSCNDLIEKCRTINQKTQYFLVNSQKLTPEIINELLANSINTEELLIEFCHTNKLTKTAIRMAILKETKTQCDALANNIIHNIKNISTIEVPNLFDISTLYSLMNLVSENENRFIDKFIFTCHAAIFQDSLFKIKSCNTMSYIEQDDDFNTHNFLVNNLATNEHKQKFEDKKINDPMVKQPECAYNEKEERPTDCRRATDDDVRKFKSMDYKQETTNTGVCVVINEDKMPVTTETVSTTGIVLSEQESVTQELENAMQELQATTLTNDNTLLLNRSANIDIPNNNIKSTAQEINFEDDLSVDFTKATILTELEISAHEACSTSSSSEASFCLLNNNKDIFKNTDDDIKLDEYEVVSKDFSPTTYDDDDEIPNDLTFAISPPKNTLELMGDN